MGDAEVMVKPIDRLAQNLTLSNSEIRGAHAALAAFDHFLTVELDVVEPAIPPTAPSC